MPEAQKLTIVQLTLSTGERLPCLVNDATCLRVTLATRWAVTCRRQRVHSSTLRDNLYALNKIYRWAAQKCRSSRVKLQWCITPHR